MARRAAAALASPLRSQREAAPDAPMEETRWETESAARFQAHWLLPRARAGVARGAAAPRGAASRGTAAPVAVAPAAAREPAARWIAPAASDLLAPAGQSQARAPPGAAPVACSSADCLGVDYPVPRPHLSAAA